MKTKPITSLCLALLAGLLPAVVGAAEPDKEADAAFAKLAADKRAAALQLTWNVRGGQTGNCFGAFISKGGLALVAMTSVAMHEKPTVVTADGKPLKFGTILKLFPEQGVALMKFNHKPKVIVSVAKKQPELGEDISVIPLNHTKPRFGTAPPILGPVMAKRRQISKGLKEPRFIEVLTLGSGLSVEQRASLIRGCFAINGNGELVAFMVGPETYPAQIIFYFYPTAALAGHVEGLARKEKGLKHPLPDASNPIDPAVNDPDHWEMIEAMTQRDGDLVRRRLKGLLDRYPKSSALRLLAATHPMTMDRGKRLLEFEDFPEPDPNDPNKARQFLQYTARGVILEGMKNKEGAIREMKSAVKCSPIDLPQIRLKLANLYLEFQLGRDAEAEQLYREAYPYMSDTIQFVEKYEKLLNKLGKAKEAAKVNDRFYELDTIFRRRRGETR